MEGGDGGNGEGGDVLGENWFVGAIHQVPHLHTSILLTEEEHTCMEGERGERVHIERNKGGKEDGEREKGVREGEMSERERERER